MKLCRQQKLLLSCFLLLSSLAVLVSVSNPATSHEASIYSSTPLSFWVSVAALAGIGAVYTFISEGRGFQWVAGGFAAWAIVLIVSLPLLRRYFYLGQGDSQSYLGMAADLLSGTVIAQELLYPVLPLLASVLSTTANQPLRFTLLLSLPVFSILFFLFTPLTIRGLSGGDVAVQMGILSALLLLPINQVTRAGVFFQPYPTTAAILSVPIVIYTVCRLCQTNEPRFSILFLPILVMFILLHPQQAFNLTIFLFAIGVVLVGYDSISHHHKAKSAHSLLLFSLVSVIIFWYWTASFAQFERSVGGFVVSIITAAGTTGDIGSAGNSLALIGGSIEEIFIKLFFISLVFCAVAGLYGLLIALPPELAPARLRSLLSGVSNFERALVFSLAPIVGMFAVYVGFSSQYFRHLGFIMAIVTIVVPLGLRHPIRALSRSGRPTGAILPVVFLVLLLASAPIIHASPYIYQPTGHVTEAEVQGYSTVFDTAAAESTISYFRSNPRRHHDGIQGHAAGFPYNSQQVSFDYTPPPMGVGDQMYLVVTSSDRDAEVDIYNEAYVSEEEFGALEENQHISRVYSNGEFDVYFETTPQGPGR